MYTLVLAALVGALASPLPVLDPNIDVATVRNISCPEWSGSGFMIGPDILVTANHVATENCTDAETGEHLLTYVIDVEHDLALMTGKLPVIKPLEYDCVEYQPGKQYIAYGRTDYITEWLREYMPSLRVVASEPTEKQDIILRDGTFVRGMWRLLSWIVPGMSGGPIVSIDTGKVTGIVNTGNAAGVGGSYSLSDTILCK